MFVFVIGTSRALTEGLDETPQHMQASMTTLFFMKPDIPRCVKIRARPHLINNTSLYELYYRGDTHGCLTEINLHNRF